MKHARSDYNRIQDSLAVEHGGIPEDEPVFLLRAQDRLAARVVRIWAMLQREEVKLRNHPLDRKRHDAELFAALSAETWAEVMDKWHTKKTADITTAQAKT